MAEQQKNRWTWEVPGFEPRKSVERDDQRLAPLARRYSISASSTLVHPSSELPRRSMAAKLQKLKDQIKHAREDYLELRQEASDLREYSTAKLDRITRYLGVLADRAHKLDQVTLESEARLGPLVNEKKRLFNELLTAKGNVKVFCRTRPLFEDEGPSIVEFPDDYSIRVNTGDNSINNPKKDFEFDRVYGPHVGQGDIFRDVQPFVQSALDGFNISIFSYGQTLSGKTHTMEGSNHDRGLYVRCYEELFDLSNADATLMSQYEFYVTMFELYNDQVHDLLLICKSSSKIAVGPPHSSVELVQEKVENPLDFCKVLKSGLECRGADTVKHNLSHLVVTIHIHYSNYTSKETLYSMLSLVDLAGSESFELKEASGEIVKDYLYVSKSLSALGDVLSALTSNKDVVPYENSTLTRILSDSLGGGNSKALMITNIYPSSSNLSCTLASLNFSARARNTEFSLGNRDTISKWRDVANDSRKELYEKENVINELRQEVLGLKNNLKEANDQCILLFNEVQKAWKVSFTLQADLKAENIILVERQRAEKEQNTQLRNQVAHLLQLEQDYKMQLQEHDSTMQNLQDKVKTLESKLREALQSADARSTTESESGSCNVNLATKPSDSATDSSVIAKRLEEELSKRDALIEKLHEENEKLFDRLTEKSSQPGSIKVSSPLKRASILKAPEVSRSETNKGQSLNAPPLPTVSDKVETAGALVKSGPEKVKTTPAGEYLTAALNDFDPEQFESFATVSDGANKLLMLVLAAVIKAGAAREHDILAEIRDAVFSFIHKMEARRVMDAMLVSRVRILYIRSLIARSPELQSIKVSPVERFLERVNSGRSRSSSRSNSPGRSPVYQDLSVKSALVDDHVHGFKVNIKQEKKSKFSSIVSKLRGIDQELWRQQITGGKLREITEEAKSFAIGNKALAALFVHTPAGELQRQIRSWLAENFDFLSVTGGDVTGAASSHVELLSTAIMDGWMAGLGAAQPPSTDALGQLLSEYTKRVYTSQLQHLKDIAGTLATEDADDSAHVSKLRSALESVDHKRRKILQQMRSDIALLSKEEGGSPVQNPSTAAEDARLASLISLDTILRQVKDVMKQTSVSSLTKTKKEALLSSLDELSEMMPSLLAIDHPCAQRQISDACRVIESIPAEESPTPEETQAPQHSADWKPDGEIEVAQWNVLQFNTGSTAPFIIKCGANLRSELVIKADGRAQEPKGGEIIRVAPKPSVLSNMNLEELKNVFAQLPEALSLLALARTADGTRARYSRLYRTLAMKVPALRDVGELEKVGPLVKGSK